MAHADVLRRCSAEHVHQKQLDTRKKAATVIPVMHLVMDFHALNA
jgi:hypothetical protein